jgi:hypothetical protein
MFDLKAQTQLADATADMMRACSLAAARSASVAASLGFSIWVQMLLPAASPWALQWDESRRWAVWRQTVSQPVAAQDVQRNAEAAPAEAPYASYRSSGGHASAQVIVG